MKVVLLQSHLDLGGRGVVLSAIAGALSRIGTDVSVLLGLGSTRQADIGAFPEGTRLLSYRYAHSGRRLPAAYLQPWFGSLVLPRELTGSFDLAINLNNTRGPAIDAANALHYVHNPIESNPHDSSLLLSSRLLWAATLRQFPQGEPPVSMIVANSSQTAQRVRDYWGRDAAVLWPPVPTAKHRGCRGRRMGARPRILVVGEFTPNRRQMDAIRVARALRGVDVALVGRASDRGYLRRIHRARSRMRLTNVDIHVDATDDHLGRLIEAADVLLNTRRGEHFGIATVQGIAAGAVPVVHRFSEFGHVLTDRGHEFLTYASRESMVEAVRLATTLSDRQRHDIARDLAGIVGDTQPDTFAERFLQHVATACE